MDWIVCQANSCVLCISFSVFWLSHHSDFGIGIKLWKNQQYIKKWLKKTNKNRRMKWLKTRWSEKYWVHLNICETWIYMRRNSSMMFLYLILGNLMPALSQTSRANIYYVCNTYVCCTLFLSIHIWDGKIACSIMHWWAVCGHVFWKKSHQNKTVWTIG